MLILFRNHLLKYHPTLVVHLIKMAKLRRVMATTEQLQLSIRDLSQVSHAPTPPPHPSKCTVYYYHYCS